MAADVNEGKLLDLLPDTHKFEIVKFEEVFDEDNYGFRAFIIINFLNVTELEKWKNEFEKKTNTIYTRRSATSAGTIYTLKWILNCHRNTRGKVMKNNAKNTKCSSRMIIKMKRPYPGQNFHVTNIELDFVHNHKMNTNEVLRFRKPDTKVIEKFKNLYSLGHSPNSAAHAHMLDLMLEHSTDFESVINDPSIFPDQRRVHYIKSIFQRENGASCINDIDILKRIGAEFNETGGQMEVITDRDQFAVAIVTPIMGRVSTTEAAGDVVFVSCNKGIDKTRVVFMTTKSRVGEIPLGAVVTSHDNESLLLSGLTCLKHLLPENSFGGRGPLVGPCVIVVEESGTEENCLKTVWSKSQILHCTLHLLQTIWRWLWESKHNSPHEVRLHLMNLSKKIVFSRTEEELEANFLQLQSDFTAMDYPGFYQQICKFYKLKHLWATCYRDDKYNCDYDTFSHAISKLVKDVVFKRNKLFTTVQIVDLLIKRLEKHFEKCLTGVTSGVLIKNPLVNLGIVNEDMTKLENDIYIIKILDSSFVVDARLGICSCCGMSSVGVCKHLHGVLQSFSFPMWDSFEMIPIEEQMILCWLATGSLLNKFLVIESSVGTMNESTICMVEMMNESKTTKLNDNKEMNTLLMLGDPPDKALLYEVELNIAQPIPKIEGN